jgi:hypothetical protein
MDIHIRGQRLNLGLRINAYNMFVQHVAVCHIRVYIEEYLDHTSCEEPHNLLTSAKDTKMAHMEMFFGTMPSHTDLGMISC